MAKYRKQVIEKFKDVPEFDRPRIKMIERGSESLSNLELLAAMVGCGTKTRDLYEIANEIVEVVENDFSKLSVENLQQIDGIGFARACQLMAAIEFSKRFLVRVGISIKNDTDVLPFVEELRNKKQEYFLTFTLDGSHRLIEKRTVFIGTLTDSQIHPREVFADAIADRAAAIIFVHNHPTLEAIPSSNDILITKRLKGVAEIIGIEVLDHIIIGKTTSFSFKNSGLLDSQL